MNDESAPPRKPPISEVGDESTAVGDVLDEAAPDFPKENVVSWSPNDGDDAKSANRQSQDKD